jgi:hypothetical protein
VYKWQNLLNQSLGSYGERFLVSSLEYLHCLNPAFFFPNSICSEAEKGQRKHQPNGIKFVK